MYGMYLHVYACICMYEPKYACCQQQQMISSEIPLREKQQTRTAKDVRELNNIHNWIWNRSPDFTVVPIPVPRQLESYKLCPILREDSDRDNSREQPASHGEADSEGPGTGHVGHILQPFKR